MIVQACINGAREEGFHLALPLTAEAMADDAARCVVAGAAEIHLHCRDDDRRESLAPAAVNQTIARVRAACPGTLIGVSTGAWIERDAGRTLAAIASWTELPDYASVNLSEDAAPTLIQRLSVRGIGIEAGLASPADAERLVELKLDRPPLRVLIEISEQNITEAAAIADGIVTVLGRSGVKRPLLLHGADSTIWHFARLAAARRWSTRIGLEDGKALPDGTPAPDNAALVRTAVDIFRDARRNAQ